MLQLPESIPGAFQNEILRGVLIQELSGLSCPSGWLSNGLDGCVRVYQNDLSWADASSYCRTQDAQLITSQSSIYNTLLRNERNSTGYWLGFKKSEGPCEIVDVNGNCATVAKFDHPNLTKKSKKLDFLGKIWNLIFHFCLVNKKYNHIKKYFLRILKDAKATKTAVWQWLISDSQILQLVFKPRSFLLGLEMTVKDKENLFVNFKILLNQDRKPTKFLLVS